MLFIVLLIVTAAGPLPLCSHMHRSKEKGVQIEKKTKQNTPHSLDTVCSCGCSTHLLLARTHIVPHTRARARRALQRN